MKFDNNNCFSVNSESFCAVAFIIHQIYFSSLYKNGIFFVPSFEIPSSVFKNLDEFLNILLTLEQNKKKGF